MFKKLYENYENNHNRRYSECLENYDYLLIMITAKFMS